MGWPIWLEAQLAYTGWAQAHPNLILGPTCSFFFFFAGQNPNTRVGLYYFFT